MEQRPWHTLSVQDIFEAVASGEQGLNSVEAARRLEVNGANKLAESKPKTLAGIFLAQFTDLMVWVLIAAAAVSGFLEEWVDAGIIAAVVIVNAILGAVQEKRAENALEALKKMAAPTAHVWRDGSLAKIPAAHLVQGDVVALEAGDSIPADLRLMESASLKVEESALTGESVPVEKTAGIIDDPGAAIGDRINMAFLGTSVSYGRGTGIVVGTGMNTQMGAIAGQLASTEKETTPLQKKLNQISNLLSIGVLGIAALIFVIGLLGGSKPLEMFLTAVSLAVAAIPEGMVAAVTIVLAMGMSRMAGKGAIIRRLPAVETLGSTQIICSDKTGTLTQNKMTVQEVWTADEELLMEAMGHCNDAKLGPDRQAVGDPTETALIDYILAKNAWNPERIRTRVRVGEIPFDSERKLSTVAISHPSGTGMRIFVKGAPDVLLARCVREHGQPEILSAARSGEIEQANEEMAGQALRVLAFAYKDGDEADFSDPSAVEKELTFCGLVGMIDPPRPEAKEAIALCRKAGILPVMITGDHKATAVAIAGSLGILGDGQRAVAGAELERMTEQELDSQIEQIGVFARVAPEHKSRIVAAWQRRGKIVAMTGDGVNDAPALKAADIGVGMGITGTDVSKGAADMVLTDDNFATIVIAVQEGRRIFNNIHKTVRFLLSSNAGEVLAILGATLLGWHILAPVHILWINLVTDAFPALALGVEPAENDIMDDPPRDSKIPFFSRRDWLRIMTVGVVEAAVTIGAYLIGGKGVTGTTMAFLTLSLAQLFATVGLQSERHSIFRIKAKEHPVLWLAFGGSALLQLILMFIPALRSLFGLAVLGAGQWLIIVGLCLIVLIVIEIQKWSARRVH